MNKTILFTLLFFSVLLLMSQQQRQEKHSIANLMQRHFDIVNEPDTGRRNQAIKEIYDRNIYSVDPGSAVNGHVGMVMAIEGLHKTLPGALLSITSPVDTHHNVARFSYSLGRPGEEPVAKGWDIVVFSNGKITHIYTFVDPLGRRQKP